MDLNPYYIRYDSSDNNLFLVLGPLVVKKTRSGVKKNSFSLAFLMSGTSSLKKKLMIVLNTRSYSYKKWWQLKFSFRHIQMQSSFWPWCWWWWRTHRLVVRWHVPLRLHGCTVAGFSRALPLVPSFTSWVGGEQWSWEPEKPRKTWSFRGGSNRNPPKSLEYSGLMWRCQKMPTSPFFQEKAWRNIFQFEPWLEWMRVYGPHWRSWIFVKEETSRSVQTGKRLLEMSDFHDLNPTLKTVQCLYSRKISRIQIVYS